MKEKLRKIRKGFLTAKQTNYIYRNLKSGNLINKNMMRQKIDQDVELDKMDDKWQ